MEGSIEVEFELIFNYLVDYENEYLNYIRDFLSLLYSIIDTDNLKKVDYNEIVFILNRFDPTIFSFIVIRDLFSK